jgi:hypothetical protein
MICSLSACPRRGMDTLAWAYTKNGVFTVRSAYHLAMERMEKGKLAVRTHRYRGGYGRKFGI